MASVFDKLCGESGAINKISEAQQTANELITGGKNAIFQLTQAIDETETLVNAAKDSPEVVKRRLREDLFNLLSREALANPTGTIARLLALRAAYQEAGPAVQRIIENVQQFIRDPLNTPLDLCEDIPNIVQVGDRFIELAESAKTSDEAPSFDADDIVETIRGSDIQTIPRFPTPNTLIDTATAGRYSGPLISGSANEAALSDTIVSSTQESGDT